MPAAPKTLQGTILHCDGDKLTVQLSALCEGGCSNCGHCGGGNPGRDWTLILTRSRHALLKDAGPGDRLTLKAEIPGAYTSALLLFGGPLLCIAMGAGVGWELGKTEPTALLGGGFGFFASAPLIWAVQRFGLPGEKGFSVTEIKNNPPKE